METERSDVECVWIDSLRDDALDRDDEREEDIPVEDDLDPLMDDPEEVREDRLEDRVRDVDLEREEEEV